MELQHIKKEFIENGYCHFSIDLIDKEFYNFLNNFKCNDTDDLKHAINSFRFDCPSLETSEHGKTYNELKSIKENLYNLHGNTNPTQIWFWGNNFSIFQKKIGMNEDGILKTIKKGIDNIINFLYDLNNTNFEHPQLQITYYDKNSRFTPHTDGPDTKKQCSVIIYLNENYDKNDGGLLILDDNEFVPEFGTIAIMDLTNHDIRHGVTEVVNGNGRFAILSFPEI